MVKHGYITEDNTWGIYNTGTYILGWCIIYLKNGMPFRRCIPTRKRAIRYCKKASKDKSCMEYLDSLSWGEEIKPYQQD